MSIERPEAFTFFGPKALIGPELKPGDAAPDFTVVNHKLEEVSLATFSGKPTLISVVPSLDTGVCTKQTIRFNSEAEALREKANFVTISADLPFAQSRWCGANDVNTIQTLSDHRDMSFGSAFGTHIKGVRMESRAVFVLDASGTVRHAEYVPVAGQEPNYDTALEALKSALD